MIPVMPIRFAAPAAFAMTLLLTIPALAGVRAPADADGIPCDPWIRSSYRLEPPPAGCQYRFNAEGTLDELVVILTLRDCFDTPQPGCDIRFTVGAAPGTPNFCTCEPPAQVIPTDPDGVARCTFSRIGGSGLAGVRLTALCLGGVDSPQPLSFAFTSPDQDASCESGHSTTLPDLALWASGLSSYRPASDLDCNGQIGLPDLALWASGLGIGCP